MDIVYKKSDKIFNQHPYWTKQPINAIEYFIEKYLKTFPLLKVNPDIIQRVLEFSSNWKNVVGLHVRSWYCGRNSWYDSSLYEASSLTKFQRRAMDEGRKIYPFSLKKIS